MSHVCNGLERAKIRLKAVKLYKKPSYSCMMVFLSPIAWMSLDFIVKRA